MKILCSFILLCLLFVPPHHATAQYCPGALLSDDFSNPSNWQIMGTKTTTWGAPGHVSVTGGVTYYDHLRGRQTYRLVRPLNGLLLNDNDWRMELDFVLNTSSALSGVILMAVTANSQHPQSAASGSTVPNHNSGIQVTVANPLGNSPTGDRVSIQAKIGNSSAGGSATIPITRGVRYYVRVERLSAQDWSLSVFTDALRSMEVPGSPVCLQTDPGMDPLDFLQQGVGTTSSPSRIMFGETDNLCIFGDVMNKSCLPNYDCDVTAGVQYTTDGNCFFQFYNSSTAGTGNTLFGHSIITFGDGSIAQLAPGQIISHTYAMGGTYQVCIRTVGYNSNLECCEDETCIVVQANCKGQFEFGKTAPAPAPNLEVFPNPSSGEITIQSEKPVKAIAVYDLSGRRLQMHTGAGTEMQLDLHQLPAGAYILEVALEGEVIIRRNISIQ